jgi:hypothetical protein
MSARILLHRRGVCRGRQELSIDWLLEHQGKVVHYYHQLGVEGPL